MSNVGKERLAISQIGITGADLHDFVQTNDCGTSLVVGGDCNIQLTFAPRFRGPRTASLLVTDNAIYPQQSVAMSGLATSVRLIPNNLSFGYQQVGTSGTQQVQLTNVGPGPLYISDISIGGKDPSDFFEKNTCGKKVDARASCIISVLFKPTKVGSRNAYIVITDNGGVSPQAINPLNGVGTK
jgi:Abnormal spindle-like microcephaly-assoc'd, ASPM-SPD-2-Hydin